MVTIFLLILTFALLVLAHEWGHFIKAKRSGVRVDEFGFGFPPRIFGVKKGETTYSLNLIPLGGFVRIHGEDGSDRSNPRSFGSKSIFKRFNILAAGVGMNLALAAFLLIVGHMVGIPQAVEQGQESQFSDQRIQIVSVAENSPASEAGLRIADSIEAVKIDGEELAITRVEDLQKIVKDNAGEEMSVIVSRGDTIKELAVIPRARFPENEGPLGVALLRTGLRSFPVFESIWRGVISTVNILVIIVIGLFTLIKDLILGAGPGAAVAGPVGIGLLTIQMIDLGVPYWLQFTALLSINLALINFLPFPALDGGRILFLFIEKLRGRPVNPNVEKWIHAAGFLVLILLILVVTFQDIDRFL